MEKRPKKILVACDCSDYAGPIFEYAVQVAKGTAAQIIVVNVINEIPLGHIQRAMNMYTAFDLDAYVTNLNKDNEASIHAMIRATGRSDLFKKIIIKRGIPYQVLLEVIAAENADLVVMGNKGRGNLADTVVGSCARKMFHRCPVALLSVRVSE